MARAAPSSASETKALQAKARTLFELGRKQFNLGQFKQALVNFSKAYDLVPLSGFLYNIAQCHRFLGSCKKAVFLYKGYLRDNPGSPNTTVVKGLVQRCEKQLAREKRTRERSTQLYREGVTLYKLGRFQDAVSRYSRAYEILPLPGYLYALGQSHHRLSQWKKAIHFYEMYLRDNPGTPETKIITSQIAECRTHYAAALKHARRGLAPGTRLGNGAPGGPLTGDTDRPGPFYKQWWFWTAVGAGVAVLVGGLAGGLANRPSKTELTLPGSDLGTRDWR